MKSEDAVASDAEESVLHALAVNASATMVPAASARRANGIDIPALSTVVDRDAVRVLDKDSLT
ncbi:hypothetical protein GCM10009713_16530 [Brevibacterium celere]